MTRRRAVCCLIAAALILGAAVVGRSLADNTPSTTMTAVAPPVCTQPPEALPATQTTPKDTVTWTEADAIALAQTAWGEGRGCSTTEIAAIMWSVLNRVDAWGGTPASQCAAPGQFHGYSPNFPVDERLYNLAVDVLCRWSTEHRGNCDDVGRVLPAEYKWFSGDGQHNYFRAAYSSSSYWDWSLPSPYTD